MARRPVTEVRALETRAALWAAIRAFGRPFTSREIRRETRCTVDQVSEYLRGLTAAGILGAEPDPSSPGPIHRLLYTLERDLGVEAPRVRRDGTFVTQGLGREQMWRTMRMLREFTVLDLAVNSSTEENPVAEETAAEYCHYLALAGYLAIVRQGGGVGKGGVPSLYRFVPTRYSGPLPPMIQRVKAVYDPNLKNVVWSEEVGRDQ